MRIVLSFERFDKPGGTESYLLTVAQHLELLGHDAVIYTPNAGGIAEQARSRGVRVVGRDRLPTACDAVFSQDAATCYELAARYPDATRLLAAHSRDHALQGVPQLRNTCHGVVVFNDRVRRWVESHAWHPPVTRLRQPVDVKRFYDLGAPRPRPSRVLLLSNYITGSRAEAIDTACRDAGLAVDRVGLTTSPTSTPEWAIADADIVIGQGRCIVEAMAGGRAAYVYGTVGGDGWVTPGSYPQLEADGFAGLTVDSVVDAATLRADLESWDSRMGEWGRDLACAHHDVRSHVAELVELIRRLEPQPLAPREPFTGSGASDELARLVRLEWNASGGARAAGHEAERLRSELDRQVQATLTAEQATRTAEQAALDAQRQLGEVLATRRYRLACAIVTPLDRLRAGRSRDAR